MKKEKQYFICQNCHHRSSQWFGRCSSCECWNTYQEETEFKRKNQSGLNKESDEREPRRVNEISEESSQRQASGIKEFDRVLGGGVVEGSVILIGGAPGAGKSTLLMNILGRLTEESKGALLYVSGEESLSQVANRAKRLKVNGNDIMLYHETNWQRVQKQIVKLNPRYLVIDSIQTMSTDLCDGQQGSLSQVKGVTFEIINTIKGRQCVCFIVGHITKDGAVAGPKLLEHMVDVVLHLENNDHSSSRVLRTKKNRFGTIEEVGLFKMIEAGIIESPRNERFSLGKGEVTKIGQATSCIVEGSRVFTVEVETLVAESSFGGVKRTSQGYEISRLNMIVAIIEKFLGIPIGGCDIYVNIVGGDKLNIAQLDLALVVSLLSSYKKRPLDLRDVFYGEISLSGVVRKGARQEIAIRECHQLSYKRFVCNNESSLQTGDMDIVPIKNIIELTQFVKDRVY